MTEALNKAIARLTAASETHARELQDASGDIHFGVVVDTEDLRALLEDHKRLAGGVGIAPAVVFVIEQQHEREGLTVHDFIDIFATQELADAEALRLNDGDPQGEHYVTGCTVEGAPPPMDREALTQAIHAAIGHYEISFRDAERVADAILALGRGA